MNVEKYASWKTVRLLKHEAIKISNNIEALKFKAIEKDEYKKELLSKKNKSFQDVMEIASIRLSKWSNNHGQNWGKAVLFTIISGFGLISYLPNLFPSIFPFFGGDEITNWWKIFYLLAEYFIPVNFNSIRYGNNLYTSINVYSIPFYLLGKIFISYGYVEVVQAFRKLK